MKKILPLVIALFAGGIAASALFTSRFIPTHDGEYHIIRFWQFYKMLASGYPFPRWAPDLNSGYGLPLFIFHYPFPNYIGAFFHVWGFGFIDAFKLSLALGYLSAVLWCYVWIRSTHSKFVAACTTIVFSFIPYWFVDIYVRGSVGEVWAISFVLLSLISIECAWPIVSAIAIAGIIVSHNITALFSFPFLALYILWRRKKYLWQLLLGIVLASYFWIPALFESKYMAGLNTVNFVDHFPDLFQLLVPSWGTGFSGRSVRFDQMSFQIGVVPMLVYFIGIVVVMLGKFRDRSLLFVLIIWGLIFYAMLKSSLWLWQLFPIVQYIQFPWRLLTLIMLFTAWLMANIAEKIPTWLTVLIVFNAIGFSIGYTHPVMYDRREDRQYITNIHFTDGTSSLENSLSTIWTGWIQTRASSRFVFDAEDAHVNIDTQSPLRYVLLVSLSKDAILTANILYFPGWHVRIDGNEAQIAYKDDGLIHVNVAEGERRVEVFFTETPQRLIADWISILSLFSVFGSGILGAVYAHRVKQFASHNRSQSSRSGHIHQRVDRRASKRS